MTQQSWPTFCYSRDYPNRDAWLGGHHAADMRATQQELQFSYLNRDDGKVRRRHEYDSPFPSRSPNPKAATIRSWRQSRAIGGSARTTVARKMLLRLPHDRTRIRMSVPNHSGLQG